MINKETNQRELAYVVKIDAIEPIIGSDNCEAAVVGGWRVMTRKGTFKAGDLAVYFEIDSKVPETETFAFLEKKHYKIKTQKYTFGGKGNFISQGLLMSAEDFDWDVTGIREDKNDEWDIYLEDKNGKAWREGDFLTKELGVTYADADDNKRKAKSADKYKIMAQRRPELFKKKWAQWFMRRNWGKKLMFLFFGKKKDKRKTFPTHLEHIHKSDEERCENIPFILQDKDEWVKTLKIDGTSSLYLLERKGKKNEYWVCSRNVRQLNRKQECYHEDNVYWEVNDAYNIETTLKELLKQHPEWEYVAIQGESAGCTSSGAKIQGDPHKFNELRFFAYNFITSDIGRWGSIEGSELLSSYGIPWVPIIDAHYILPDNFEEFKLSADGPCEAAGSSGRREGYVYRRAKFIDGKINSFKNVSREYLLKH